MINKRLTSDSLLSDDQKNSHGGTLIFLFRNIFNGCKPYFTEMSGSEQFH